MRRKKKSGIQKVWREYGSVIAVAALFVALCACVALRGNSIHWKTEAHAAQDRFLSMEKRFGDMQITHAHLKVRPKSSVSARCPSNTEALSTSVFNP